MQPLSQCLKSSPESYDKVSVEKTSNQPSVELKNDKKQTGLCMLLGSSSPALL